MNPYGRCECGCGGITSIAAKTITARGVVAGKPYRFMRGHARRKSPVDYLEEDHGHTTPCWIWQLSLSADGYARRHVAGRTVSVHRYLYEQRFGPIPAGASLDHLCRVRGCVNPEHLEPVTHPTNVRRGNNAKLSAEQRAYAFASPLSSPKVAAELGVHRSTILKLRRGETWANATRKRSAKK